MNTRKIILLAVLGFASFASTQACQAVVPVYGPECAPVCNDLTVYGPDNDPSKLPVYGPEDEPVLGPEDEPVLGPEDEPVLGPDNAPIYGPENDPSKKRKN